MKKTFVTTLKTYSVGLSMLFLSACATTNALDERDPWEGFNRGVYSFNTTKEGKPLFDKKGSQTEILNQAVNFLKDYQSHVQLTTLFCENLSKLDILEPMQANIEQASGEKYSLGGFMGVNREKLKILKPVKLAELLKSDQMELIFAHIASLSNLNALMKRLN